MNEREAFIHQIRENPDDEFPRLVYADYLEEMGDVRGELIRLQCKLPKLDVMGEPWRTTRRRIKELLNANAERWLAPLRDAGAEGIALRSFQRGLIERVVVKQGTAAQALERLCELEPALQYVELRVESHEQLQELELPAQVTTLDISHNSFQDVSEDFLSSLAWASSLRGFVARNCRLDDKQMSGLLNNQFENLTALSLDGNRFSWETLGELVKKHWFPGIEDLSLCTNSIGARNHQEQMPRGIMSVLGGIGTKLESLAMATCNLRDGDVNELLESPGASQLRSLNLRSNSLSLKVIASFVEQDSMPNLAELDIRASVPHSSSSQYGYGTGSVPELAPVIARLKERYGDGVRV